MREQRDRWVRFPCTPAICLCPLATYVERARVSSRDRHGANPWFEAPFLPFEPYAWGRRVHPDEHVLQLPVTTLRDILRAARTMGERPECRIYGEFVMHPVHLSGIRWNG